MLKKWNSQIHLFTSHSLAQRTALLSEMLLLHVILSRNQFSTFGLWRNRHQDKNVAKAQIKAQDISRGIEMVKLKTNEAITKKKAGLNSLQTLHYGSKGATPVHMQGPLALNMQQIGRAHV